MNIDNNNKKKKTLRSPATSSSKPGAFGVISSANNNEDNTTASLPEEPVGLVHTNTNDSRSGKRVGAKNTILPNTPPGSLKQTAPQVASSSSGAHPPSSGRRGLSKKVGKKRPNSAGLSKPGAIGISSRTNTGTSTTASSNDTRYLEPTHFVQRQPVNVFSYPASPEQEEEDEEKTEIVLPPQQQQQPFIITSGKGRQNNNKRGLRKPNAQASIPGAVATRPTESSSLDHNNNHRSHDDDTNFLSQKKAIANRSRFGKKTRAGRKEEDEHEERISNGGGGGKELAPDQQMTTTSEDEDDQESSPLLHSTTPSYDNDEEAPNNQMMTVAGNGNNKESLDLSLKDENITNENDNDGTDDNSGAFLIEATLVEDNGDGKSNKVMTEEERIQLEQDTRKKVMEEMMVDAEAAVIVVDNDDTDAHEKSRQRRRRRLLLLFFVVALILLGIILGIVLTNGNKEKSATTAVPKIIEILKTPSPTISFMPSTIPTPAPTSSVPPSQLPSMSPSISTVPSSTPSLVPSTSLEPSQLPSNLPSFNPSESPTTSFQPSQLPSLPPSQLPSNLPTETPDNNYCKDATPVSVGDTVVVEELYSGSSETYIPTPPDTQDSTIVPSTSNPTSLAPTSSPRSVVFLNPKSNKQTFTNNIFAARNSQQQQQQLQSSRQFVSDDDSFGGGIVYHDIIGCKDGGMYSAPGRWFRFRGVGPVTVTTCNEGTTIDAFVQVYANFDSCLSSHGTPTECPSDLQHDEGTDGCSIVSWNSVLGADYLLLATEKFDINGQPGSIAMTILNNDLCENAFGPLSPGSSISGSIRSEVATVDENVPACGDASQPNQPGVWFQIMGTGGLLKADTCSGTVINTQISVYKEGCTNLQCVAGNNNACRSQSLISWNSENGVIYHVLVHGGSASLGDFFLNVQGEGSSLAPNDICENAKLLEVESGNEIIVTVPMGQASVDASMAEEPCIGIWNDQARRGLWFTVSGREGTSYHVSVSSLVGDDAEVVAFFGNDCADLSGNCDRNDPYFEGRSASWMRWDSVPGERYYIYVHYMREDVTVSYALLNVTATPTA